MRDNTVVRISNSAILDMPPTHSLMITTTSIKSLVEISVFIWYCSFVLDRLFWYATISASKDTIEKKNLKYFFEIVFSTKMFFMRQLTAFKMSSKPQNFIYHLYLSVKNYCEVKSRRHKIGSHK